MKINLSSNKSSKKLFDLQVYLQAHQNDHMKKYVCNKCSSVSVKVFFTQIESGPGCRGSQGRTGYGTRMFYAALQDKTRIILKRAKTQLVH